MLFEIMCSEFKDHGKPRGRIRLRAGLNTVLGSDSGSNSIGKSTFLMILDFIFGGSDYVDKLTDVQTEVGVHTINFAFQFKDGMHYFARSTGDYNIVMSCDSNYMPLNNGTMSLNEYMDFLQRNYGLDLTGLSLRNAVGRFIRVYKRETLDEERPLHQAKQETAKAAIEGLLKIVDLYSGIAEQSKITKEAKEKHDIFKKAQKYQYIPFVTKKSEYERNEERIRELASHAEELAHRSSNGLLDLDSMQAERLSMLHSNLSNFKRQRAKIISQLRAIRADKELGKRSFKRNFEDLQRFFPEVNLRRIESIEGFHKQLAGILKDEFSEMEENLQSSLMFADVAQMEMWSGRTPRE